MNLLKRVHCLLGKAPRRRPLRLSSLTALFVLTSVASLSAMTVLRPQDEERQREERDRVQQRDREEERERLEQRDRQRAQEREQRDVERRRTREEREARKGRRQRARETREEPQSDVDARRRGRIDADRSDAIDPRERAPDNRDFNPRERQGRYPDVSDERARAPFDSHLWHPPVGRGDLPPEPHFGANVPHSTDLPPHVNDPYGRRFHGEEHAPFPRGVEPYGDGRHPPMGAPGYTGESRPEGPFESAPRPPRGTPDSRGEFFDAPAPSDPSGSNRFGPQGPPMSRQQPNVPRVQQGENVDEELLQMMREMRNEIRQLQREVETLRQQVEVAPRLRGQDLPQRGVDPLRAPRNIRWPDRLEDPRRRAPAVDEMRMREPRRSADEFFPQANTQPAPLSSPATPAPSTRPALPERLSQPREVAPQSGNPLPSSPIAPARAAEPQERALPTPAAQPLLDDALPPVTAEEATVDPVDAGEESAPVPSNPSQESAAKESRDEGDGR